MSLSDGPRVVLFTGGRGSSALSRQLLKKSGLRLTLAINGYDDGASTGEVRRLLGDSLGPSDFRKNASHVARETRSVPVAIIDLLDKRLPTGLSREEALRVARRWTAAEPACADLLELFVQAWAASGQEFELGDCSIGNLVFAGAFLREGRRFNRALDHYCSLVGLPPGLVDNVTAGENAYLVAIGEDGSLMGSEEELVAGTHPRQIREVFLVERPLNAADRQRLGSLSVDELSVALSERRASVSLNERLARRLAEADLIIYAPGTQHSSLFPSYVTPGIARVIAGNIRSVKVLITNLRSDAEIAGASASDIIEKALFYLNGKGRLGVPAPCLITHCLVNDPGHGNGPVPYVPLGPVQAFDDSHAIRIANYEDGVSGQHNAVKILSPLLRSVETPLKRRRLVVMLEDVRSANKTIQTLLEIARGGIGDLNLDVTVIHVGEAVDAELMRDLPFDVSSCRSQAEVQDAIVGSRADFVLLFEASGMYRGEDVTVVASQIAVAELDAVWGSRRLSVRAIDESIRARYRRSRPAGAISRIGSHVLSMACLALYGRHVSDTLSGVRACRLSDALAIDVPLTDARVNQHLLGQLLQRKAELIEVPVRFMSISPEEVRRTTITGGMHALAILVGQGFFRKFRRAPNVVAIPHEEHG